MLQGHINIINMNNFCVKTKLTMPVLDWRKFWPDCPGVYEDRDLFPRWRKADPMPAMENFWPNNDIPSKLRDVNLIPEVFRIFRWAPNKFFTWHIDARTPVKPNFCAINWVVEGQGEIQWSTTISLEDQHAEAYRYKLGDWNDSFDMSAHGHCCLVNTAIPHRVFNKNNQHRLSYSLLFHQDISYEDAYKKLKQVNLIDE